MGLSTAPQFDQHPEEGGQYETSSGFSQQQTQSLLEEDNNEITDDLRHKVRALKSLTIDIGNEVRDQNDFLNKMDSDFDQSQGFLGATMKRVQNMARIGFNCHIFYLLAFAMFVFFICWLIIKTR